MENESRELCSIVNTFEGLEKTKNELYYQNKELISTISCLNKTIKNLEKVHKEDKILVCKHETTIENLKTVIRDLQYSVQRKNQDIAQCGTLYKAFENLEKENVLLVKDKEICEVQLCIFKDTVIKLEEKFQEKDCLINMQANQLNEIKVKLGDYKCKFEEMLKQKEKNQCYMKELKKELAMETARNAELCAKQNLAEEEGKKKNCLFKQLKETIGYLTRKLNEMDRCRQELEREKEEFMKYKNTLSVPTIDSFCRPCNITKSQPILQSISYIKSRKSFFDRLFKEQNHYLINTPQRHRNPESIYYEQNNISSEKSVMFDETLNTKCVRNKCDESEKNRKEDEGDNNNVTKPSEASDNTIGNGGRSQYKFAVTGSTSKDINKNTSRSKSRQNEKSNNKASRSMTDKASHEKQERKGDIYKAYTGNQSSRSGSRKQHRRESDNPFVLSKSSQVQGGTRRAVSEMKSRPHLNPKRKSPKKISGGILKIPTCTAQNKTTRTNSKSPKRKHCYTKHNCLVKST